MYGSFFRYILALLFIAISGCDGDGATMDATQSIQWSNGYRLSKIISHDESRLNEQTTQYHYSADGTTVTTSHIGPLIAEGVGDINDFRGSTANVAFDGGACTGTVEIDAEGRILQASSDDPGCFIDVVSDTEVETSNSTEQIILDSNSGELISISGRYCQIEFIYAITGVVTEMIEDCDNGLTRSTYLYNSNGQLITVEEVELHQGGDIYFPIADTKSTAVIDRSLQAEGQSSVSLYGDNEMEGIILWNIIWHKNSEKIAAINPLEPDYYGLTGNIDSQRTTYELNGNPKTHTTYNATGEITSTTKFVYEKRATPVVNIGLWMTSINFHLSLL